MKGLTLSYPINSSCHAFSALQIKKLNSPWIYCIAQEKANFNLWVGEILAQGDLQGKIQQMPLP